MRQHEIRKESITEFLQVSKQTGQLLLKHVHKAIQAQSGCSVGHFGILKVIDQKGPLLQHAIAQELHNSDAAVSKQVTHLLEKEYITATVDPMNRRSTVISITPSGKAVLRNMESAIKEYFTHLLNDFPEEHLSQLIFLQKELQHILAISGEKESHEHE